MGPSFQNSSQSEDTGHFCGEISALHSSPSALPHHCRKRFGGQTQTAPHSREGGRCEPESQGSGGSKPRSSSVRLCDLGDFLASFCETVSASVKCFNPSQGLSRGVYVTVGGRSSARCLACGPEMAAPPQPRGGAAAAGRPPGQPDALCLCEKEQQVCFLSYGKSEIFKNYL